jgi:hypothetical protein
VTDDHDERDHEVDAAAEAVAERLRAAVRHEAAGVRVDEDAALVTVRERGVAARRRRRTVAAGVGAAVAVVVVAFVTPRLGDGRDHTVTDAPPTTASAPTTVPPAPGTTGPDATEAPTATAPAPDGTTEPTGPPTTTTPDSPPVTADEATGPSSFTRPPLWPFRSPTEVEEWQRSHDADGTDAWHLDAEETALRFTGDFLGFAGIDRVVASDVGADEAYVTVGYSPGSGESPAPAANIHLIRYGSGAGAPWEVVGTADSGLTLDTPRYGTAATSPLAVGGTVTGVDESLRVQVRQPSSPAPLGESCCVPAGGEATPWEATVSFTGATDPALTVVVSTGGHVQDVERFAITALRR